MIDEKICHECRGKDWKIVKLYENGGLALNENFFVLRITNQHLTSLCFISDMKPKKLTTQMGLKCRKTVSE